MKPINFISFNLTVLFLVCVLVAISCSENPVNTDTDINTDSEIVAAFGMQQFQESSQAALKFIVPVEAGPAPIAECGDFDIVQHSQGTVRVTILMDQNGMPRRIHALFNLDQSWSNSVTGFALSGRSHGPDIETINEDGSVNLRVRGVVRSAKIPGGRMVVLAGHAAFQFDPDGELVDFQFHGNDDFLAVTTLCDALTGD
jgi:hypothetical protein